jgi:(1->4)-alpha-D-glucan 1-alpha-D-glucosylmutase
LQGEAVTGTFLKEDAQVSEADLVAQARAALEQAYAEIVRRRLVPVATYRIQLHAGFTFRQATEMVPYLAALGISDCYASPFLKAAPGSMHGYDITDHHALNPEIGTPDEFEAWMESLREHGMGLLMDVVPNHMGILGNENTWWNDVLENGRSSPYAAFFDIDWSAPVRPENRGKVLVPLLGDLYGEVLERGELRLGRDGGSFHVQYHDHRIPLDPSSYRNILEPALEPITRELGPEDPGEVEFQSILTAIRNLPQHSETDPPRTAERQREKEVIKRRLTSLVGEQKQIEQAIDDALASLNGTPGDPRSFDSLDVLLGSQPYRLAYWRVARDEINYRRFFDVNALVALRMDSEEVFRATHDFILDLATRPEVVGLRIDHPDGLLDPQGYLDHLQKAFVLAMARKRHEEDDQPDRAPWAQLEPAVREQLGQDTSGDERPAELYVVVEKILGFDEAFPSNWRGNGTSGYDMLNRLSGLFVDPKSGGDFTRRYQEWIGNGTPYREMIRQKKVLILDALLASELHVLAYQLERIALRDRKSRDFTQSALRYALREVIASFPFYRSYVTPTSVSELDRLLIDRAIRSAMLRNPVTSRSIFLFLRNVLLGRVKDNVPVPEEELAATDFAGKFQQVTAPVMAKGLEDTTFFVYNRLVALNEVGGEPVRFGVAPEALHQWNRERASRFPHALSPLSTHDTKRSEDVRARINVLSEIPDAWFAALARWSELNKRHRVSIEDHDAPDGNEEYYFYQNLLGAWPIGEIDDQGFLAFRERIRAFMGKSLHEAKVHSSWQNPDEEYDKALDNFVLGVLDRESNRAFLDDFLDFQRVVHHHGMLNSLAQTLLKIASPGVPDTYQGTEIWDFSLVDPDNRRPVDYALRRAMLEELRDRSGAEKNGLERLLQSLVASPDDGRIKLYLHWRGLSARRESPTLFACGEYRPIAVKGAQEKSLFGFVRVEGRRLAVVAVPRLTAALVQPPQFPLGLEIWKDTILDLPGIKAGTKLVDVFTQRRFETQPNGNGGSALKAGEVLSSFPVALLLT